MDLFNNNRKVDSNKYNIEFAQNFYKGNTSSRRSTFSVEQIRKDLKPISLKTNIMYTTNEPIIKVDNRQLENYFDNTKPVSRNNKPSIEYNVVTQKQDPLELITPYTYRSVSDKSGTQFAANRTSLKETELRYNITSTRSEMPYSETVYD